MTPGRIRRAARAPSWSFRRYWRCLSRASAHFSCLADAMPRKEQITGVSRVEIVGCLPAKRALLVLAKRPARDTTAARSALGANAAPRLRLRLTRIDAPAVAQSEHGFVGAGAARTCKKNGSRPPPGTARRPSYGRNWAGL